MSIVASVVGLSYSQVTGENYPVPRRYRLECDTLELVKGDELTSANLSGGVTLQSHDGMSVRADNGIVEVVSRVVNKGLSVGESIAETEAESVNPKLKPPSETWNQSGKPEGKDKSVSNAGSGALPKIAPEDIKRIELSGNVVMTSKEGTLECESVYSEDGGRTWKTRGASRFTGKGENKGTRFAADSLQFNGEKGTLSGQGGVKITIPANGAGKNQSGTGESGLTGSIGKGDVNVSAGAFEFVIEKNVLTLTGNPTVTQKSGKITAGSLVYYGETGRIEAKNGVRIEYPEKHIVATADSAVYGTDGKIMFTGNVRVEQTDKKNALTCGEIVYVEKTGDVTAKDAVRLEIPDEEMILTADTLQGNIPDERGVAKGNPKLTRGGSSVKGEEIRYKRESDRIVVEVLGQDKTEYVIEPGAFEGEL